jgi:hypothetical protein
MYIYIYIYICMYIYIYIYGRQDAKGADARTFVAYSTFVACTSTLMT